MSELPAIGAQVTWAKAAGADLGVVQWVQTIHGEICIGVEWPSTGILWFTFEEFERSLTLVEGEGSAGDRLPPGEAKETGAG